MCLLCIEIAKNKMTIREVRQALPEMVNTAKDKEEKEHYTELRDASDEEIVAKASAYNNKQPKV